MFTFTEIFGEIYYKINNDIQFYLMGIEIYIFLILFSEISYYKFNQNNGFGDRKKFAVM